MLSEEFNAKVAEVSPLSIPMCYEKTAGPGIQSGPVAEGGFRGRVTLQSLSNRGTVMLRRQRKPALSGTPCALLTDKTAVPASGCSFSRQI